jgi:tetratricopeptide (TPR) repeat protein
MRNLTRGLILLAVSQFCYGQDYKSQFSKFLQVNDTVNQNKILTEWEKADPKNAELFTSYFNYYFHKSKHEFISLTKVQPKGESMSLVDSTGQAAGYLGNQVNFERAMLQKAIDKINEGIKMYPNRLDMRFGKIYALGQAQEWDGFTSEIVNTIRYSSQNNNEWTWTNNEQKQQGKTFLLSSLQDYQVQLYNTGDDKLLNNMRTIANEVLKLNPSHIESLSNLSLTYLLTGEYDKALEILFKAEKINPKDPVVLSNIAHGYKSKGDKKKAIDYYEKIILYSEEPAVGYAKQQIEELKK